MTHQGAEFFADAPQSGAVPDIAVYDVAPRWKASSLKPTCSKSKAENGQLHVIERYFVHNTSMPPRTQWSPKSFEIVLPGRGGYRVGAGTAAEHRQPAHHAEAAARWTEGPLRLQLSHPAR